jgi:hypothetical protein
MTKNEMAAVVSGSSYAMANLIAAFRSADDDGMRGLIDQLMRATADDIVEDISRDLRSEDYDDAADFVDDNYA